MHIKQHRALINVGILKPLPSIPILSPVVTPLVDGSRGTNSSPAPAPAPPPPQQHPPPPAPNPTPPAPQPAPAPTVVNPPPTENPPSSPSPSQPSSGDGGSTGGGSSGDPGSGSPSPGGGVGTENPSTGDGSGAGSGTGGTSDPTTGTNDPSGSTPGPLGVNNVAVQPSVDGGNDGNGNGDGDGNGNGNGGGGGHVMTTVSVDASGVSRTITFTAPSSSGSPDANGALGGNGGGNNADGNNGNGAGNGAAHKKGVSPGVIGAIVTLLVLAAIAVVILVLRRRYRARRSARRAQWTGIAALANQRKSTRSSFADRGERPDTMQSFDEYVSAASHTSPPEAAHVHETRRLSGAESPEMMMNRDSAQYLTLPAHDGQTVAQFSPISVRPWSPSESWSFPKPPNSAGLEDGPGDTASIYSSAYQKTLNMGTTDPNAPPVPPIPNPFSDPVASSSTENEDPFGDDSPTPSLHSATSLPAAAVVQAICRPFAPSLPDELAVVRGDLVRLVREFDDGWCQVVVLRDGVPEGEGLIPIACLSDSDKKDDKPDFMAKKRTSSYSGPATAI